MKKLISLLIVFCMIFSTFTLVSVSAETQIEYEKNYPCNKLFDVFKFSESNYRKDLSNPPDKVSFDENNNLNFSFETSVEKSTMFFEVTKADNDLIGFVENCRKAKLDLSDETNPIETIENFKMYLYTDVSSEKLSGFTNVFMRFKFVYEDETCSSVSDELWKEIDEKKEFVLKPAFLNIDTEKTIKYVCLEFDNSDNEDLSGAKGSISSLKCHYSVANHDTVIVGKQESTCIQAGFSGREYCNICKEYLTIGGCYAPNANNHTNIQELEAKKPTCTDNGHTAGKYCKDCKKTFEPQTVLKATGHNAKWIVDKKATYFAKGKQSLKCEECNNAIKTKSIAKLKLKTPKFKYTKDKGKFTVKYTRVKNATGFKVRYKLKNKWKAKTYETNKSATKVIKNLKKGNYKVQIRAFVKSGNKIAYSDWTKIKTVKVK